MFDDIIDITTIKDIVDNAVIEDINDITDKKNIRKLTDITNDTVMKNIIIIKDIMDATATNRQLRIYNNGNLCEICEI
jgi:hypothetical protein